MFQAAPNLNSLDATTQGAPPSLARRLIAQITNVSVFLVPFVLALVNQLTWRHLDGLQQMLAQMWTGLVALGGMAYAAGLLPYSFLKPAKLFRTSERARMQHPWFAWILMAGWTMAWSFAWLTLPAGNFLRFALPAAFFELAWRCLGPADAYNTALRRSMALTLVVVSGCIVVWVLRGPFRLARLLGDWTGPLEATGRHFEHVQVLKAWRVLNFWGPSHKPLTDVRFSSNGMELLQLMGDHGALPGIVMGVALILGWWALWNWLRRVAPSENLTIEMRRLGLALLFLHGLATLSYVLFNLGLTRHSAVMGLPPMVPQAAWWMFGLALAWIVFQAARADRAVTHVVDGKHWWLSMMGYALVGFVLTVVILVLKENQRSENYAGAGNRAGYATREVIRDAENHVIAVNMLAYDLWFKPSDFWAPSLLNPRTSTPESIGYTPKRTDTEREHLVLDALAKWPQTRSVVEARLASWPKSKDGPAILAWAVTPEAANALVALEMPGLLIKPRTARHYPGGALYAHAVGFAGLSDAGYGQEGLELVANRQLVTVSAQPDARERQGVLTTLVPVIQKAARDALQAGIKEHHATGGAIVVMDVQKSEIAAMVSAPDFDPNDLSTYRNPYQPDRILNRATSLSFPIGALITPLIAAHGIESGRVAPDTKTDVGGASANGVLTVEDIIAKSSDVGLARLALQIPLAEMQGINKTLGLGEPLGIPGLAGGFVAERKEWAEWTPMMHAAPGQSIETNLMQVLKAYMPIATSGYLQTPTLLASSQGDLYGKRVLSSDTAATLRQALKVAASDRGTAPLAQIPGTTVAGKTATTTGSYWTDAETGRKVLRPDTAAFIGMLPAEQPKWLVGVLLEFGTGKVQYAGLSTAPIFAQLASKALLQETGGKP